MQKTILLTRPDNRGQEIHQKLSKLGYQVFSIPCLAIEPRDWTQDTLGKINSLQDYQIIIFVSVNAVECFFRYCAELPSLLHTKFLAIGKQTAASLHQFGIKDVIFPTSEFNQNSESFIGLEELQNIKNSKVLLVRGDQGRKYISTYLLENDAELTELIVYTTHSPAGLDVSLKQFCFTLEQEEQRALSVLITSEQILINFTKNISKKYLPQILNCRLIVISERIADSARALGYQNIFITNTMNEDSIIAMIG